MLVINYDSEHDHFCNMCILPLGMLTTCPMRLSAYEILKECGLRNSNTYILPLIRNTKLCVLSF